MIAPPKVPRNAARAQGEGRAKEGKTGKRSAAKGHYRGRSPKAPAPLAKPWRRARREAARSQGVVRALPGVMGCYSSSTNVTSKLTL
jgi:hypothetical protein